jgi:hypothetical protein
VLDPRGDTGATAVVIDADRSNGPMTSIGSLLVNTLLCVAESRNFSGFIGGIRPGR